MPTTISDVGCFYVSRTSARDEFQVLPVIWLALNEVTVKAIQEACPIVRSVRYTFFTGRWHFSCFRELCVL
jgi:hypothetical protein